MRKEDYHYLLFANKRIEDFHFFDDPRSVQQAYMEEMSGQCCHGKKKVQEKYKRIINEALEKAHDAVDE